MVLRRQRSDGDTATPREHSGLRGWGERLPLRWRLALGYALVLLLVLAPLAAVQAVAIHTLLVDDATSALLAAARAEAAAVGHGGTGKRKETAPLSGEQIARDVAGPGTMALVVDAAGNVAGAATPPAAPAAALLLAAPAGRAALVAAREATYQVQSSLGPYLVALVPLPRPPSPKVPKAHLPATLPADSASTSERLGAVPLQASARSGNARGPVAGTGQTRRALLLAQSLAPISAVTTRIWLLTLFGTALALVLATALGTVLVRRSLRPLGRVASAAEAMAAGQYSRRVPAPPVRDEVGHLAVAFTTMAAAVEDAFATQSRFVADAAHELRTPLTALNGYADVLLMGAASNPGDLAAALTAMHGEARRMTRLVNSLLTLARLDVDGSAMRWADVDAAQVLREVYHGVCLLHTDRHFSLDAPPEPVLVGGDADGVRQVVANLVSNAVKFTDTGGHVALALHVAGESVCLEVRDDGMGIAPEDLPHVCERFYRADMARSRATGGTGLGLSIVHAIVTAHGGSLHLHSGPGQGTTVTVRLPCPQVAHRPAAPAGA